MSESGESELIAQELSGLGHKLTEFEKRLTEVEKVNARLELAALTTARALQEVSQHWDAVYEAMRRPGVKDLGPRAGLEPKPSRAQVLTATRPVFGVLQEGRVLRAAGVNGRAATAR